MAERKPKTSRVIELQNNKSDVLTDGKKHEGQPRGGENMLRNEAKFAAAAPATCLENPLFSAPFSWNIKEELPGWI